MYSMYSPDEIENIRAEMNRDAMPSKEEAKAEHRNYLRRKGCTNCGESDPDKLDTRYIRYPSCKALQTPPDPTVVLCDECHAERPSLRERAYRKARTHNERYNDPELERSSGDKTDGEVIAVTFFECDDWRFVHQPLIDDGTGATYPHPHVQPHTPIECRCGSDISEIARLSELAEEFEDEDEDEDDGGESQ